MDALQYFHYGHLVHHGEATDEMRVLARSAGVTADFISLALETARVPVLEGSTGVSWGLVRTKRGKPLIIARAERVAPDSTLYQFIEVSTDNLRELSGNLALFRQYLTEPLHAYDMLGDSLQPIQITNTTLTTEQQVDTLLELMSLTRNNTRNIEPLIAAIVTGTPLIITNAPADGNVRLDFIQGLLTLLPASTRLGVTFLSHNTMDSGLKAQIAFMQDAPADDESVVYDWETSATQGKEIKNEYSRFVTSQMRLDPEAVTRETDKLTRTAGWRFNNGDSLAKALDYASHRAKVDQALENGMPVEVASVAEILAADPTLSDEQRLMYSRHLINFSLALEDLQYVDAITATMNQHKDLEDEVYRYMARALESGQASVIFETLVRWRENPFSPTGPRWQEMLSRSALSELEQLTSDEDLEQIEDFMEDVKRLGTQARPIIGRVIDLVLPFADRDPSIPVKALLLAIYNLDETKLQLLLTSPKFMQPLPPDVKRLLALCAQRDRQAPPGIIMRALQSIPEADRPAALIAFVRLAYQSQRMDLMEEPVLEALVNAVRDDLTLVDRDLFTALAPRLHTKRLKLMRYAPRYILQLILVAHNYPLLSRMMTAQARDIYGPEKTSQYVDSIRQTFANTKLDATDAINAIKVLKATGIGDIALSAAILGALEGTDWHVDLKPYADRAMRNISDSNSAIEILPAPSIYSLLQFYSRHGDERRLKMAARIMGSCAAYDKGKAGMTAANRGYKMMHSSDQTAPLAIEVVRQYVREADDESANQLIQLYGERLGEQTMKQLQLSYEFSNLMARLDWTAYDQSLQITVDMLQAAVNAFEHEASRPSLNDARLVVDRLRRRLSLGEIRALTEDMRQIAHSIVELGHLHNRKTPANDRHHEAVATGKSDPRSALDVFRSAGGYLLESSSYPFRTQEGEGENPLGETDPIDLSVNITVASTLLDAAANTAPTNRDIWKRTALVDEIDSQVGAYLIDINHLRQMGRNWQRLADLVIHISKTGDAKIIETKNARGRRLDQMEVEPENVLELLRFIYGHLAADRYIDWR